MTKKAVDIPKEQALKYYPKCSVVLFFQPSRYQKILSYLEFSEGLSSST
jgi:hypothetical protein